MDNAQRSQFINQMTVCPKCDKSPVFSQRCVELRDQIRVAVKALVQEHH